MVYIFASKLFSRPLAVRAHEGNRSQIIVREDRSAYRLPFH